MGRRRHELAIRVILVTGILTTIATSAPPSDSVQDERSVPVDAMGVTTLQVRFSAAAVEQANDLRLLFVASAGATVTLVPDDPAQPVVPIVGTVEIDATELCAPTGPCELGFSLDAGDDPAASLIDVTAFASRGGDASFCFPDNDPFTADATVEVVFAQPAAATTPPAGATP
jgi:hypothetical protein